MNTLSLRRKGERPGRKGERGRRSIPPSPPPSIILFTMSFILFSSLQRIRDTTTYILSQKKKKLIGREGREGTEREGGIGRGRDVEGGGGRGREGRDKGGGDTTKGL